MPTFEFASVLSSPQGEVSETQEFAFNNKYAAMAKARLIVAVKLTEAAVGAGSISCRVEVREKGSNVVVTRIDAVLGETTPLKSGA